MIGLYIGPIESVYIAPIRSLYGAAMGCVRI